MILCPWGEEEGAGGDAFLILTDSDLNAPYCEEDHGNII